MIEDQYYNIVDMSPDIIYRLDKDGRIIFISKAVRDLGYSPDGLLGSPFENMVHPEDRGRGPSHFVEKRVGERAIRKSELRLMRKNENTPNFPAAHVTVEVTSKGTWDVPDSDIMNPDKHFLYTQGIARDITEQVRMKKEKENLINQFRHALLKIKTLSGIIPICNACKKIRNGSGQWQHLEDYIREHTDAEFSHSMCPECARKMYPEYFK